MFMTAKNRPGLKAAKSDSQVKGHEMWVEIPTMRIAPVQKANVRWTHRPFDICSLFHRLRPHGALQTENRRIHPGLDRFHHLCEWHSTAWKQVCLREGSHHWKM